MDQGKVDKIRSELRKAEEYFRAAEVLHKNALRNPSVASSYFAAYHACVAAFLTSGTQHAAKEPVESLKAILHKFNSKLDPMMHRTKGARHEFKTSIDYTDKETTHILYLTKELFMEIKDFLRVRLMKA